MMAQAIWGKLKSEKCNAGWLFTFSQIWWSILKRGTYLQIKEQTDRRGIKRSTSMCVIMNVTYRISFEFIFSNPWLRSFRINWNNWFYNKTLWCRFNCIFITQLPEEGLCFSNVYGYNDLICTYVCIVYVYFVGPICRLNGGVDNVRFVRTVGVIYDILTWPTRKNMRMWFKKYFVQ